MVKKTAPLYFLFFSLACADVPEFSHIARFDIKKFKEPSGIVYHPLRKTLFAVSDEGRVVELSTTGQLIKKKRVQKADFEGITCDPNTGLLYVAVEGKERILEVDPDRFDVLRTFDIRRSFQGKKVLQKGGQGIEGITFVPDAEHPHGGTFYVANQSFDLEETKDLSAVFEIEVPLRSDTKKEVKVEIIRSFSIGVTDLSGMHYNTQRERLYMVSDKNDALFEVNRAGGVLRQYVFPGQSQEGITFDGDGFVYVAQNTGGILKLKWQPATSDP